VPLWHFLCLAVCPPLTLAQVLVPLIMAATIGAPLLAWVAGALLRGDRYRRARWPLIVAGTYYGVLLAHEVAGRFVNVHGPMMLLVVAGPFVAIVVLSAPSPGVRNHQSTTRGFDPIIKPPPDA
jgi:hypothetical protein